MRSLDLDNLWDCAGNINATGPRESAIEITRDEILPTFIFLFIN